MQILLNGTSLEISEQEDLGSLLRKQCLNLSSCAIAVNRTVIPRSEILKIRLKEGDKIEIVHAVGGG